MGARTGESRQKNGGWLALCLLNWWRVLSQSQAFGHRPVRKVTEGYDVMRFSMASRGTMYLREFDSKPTPKTLRISAPQREPFFHAEGA
jgi:hypothetical protein